MIQPHDLGLAEPVAAALAADRLGPLSPLHLDAARLAIEGRDLLAEGEAAGDARVFILPIIERLCRRAAPTPRRSALVLAPTRELVVQLAESLHAYGRRLGFSVVALIDGQPVREQTTFIARGQDVLVATPERLLELLTRDAMTLDHTEIFALDETHQMLELGLIHPLGCIAPFLPADRQTILVSATMPEAIVRLAAIFLRNPSRARVARVAAMDEVEQVAIFAEEGEKPALLLQTLREPCPGGTLIFTRSRQSAERVAARLEAAGVEVAVSHSRRTRLDRARAFAAFREGRIRALVLTDAALDDADAGGAARIVNFDLPREPENYARRIGRLTGGDAASVALSFVSEEDRPLLRSVERRTGRVIPKRRLPATFLFDAMRSELPATPGPAAATGASIWSPLVRRGRLVSVKLAGAGATDGARDHRLTLRA